MFLKGCGCTGPKMNGIFGSIGYHYYASLLPALYIRRQQTTTPMNRRLIALLCTLHVIMVLERLPRRQMSDETRNYK
jgi:hypothetical protein